MFASTSCTRVAGITAGCVADALFGDPRRGHPVAIFGSAAAALEQRSYADTRSAGMLHTGVLLGALAVLGLLTGVLRMYESYASINWKTVFMMAGLIPLGWAMDSSGAAAWVAGHTIDKLPTGIPVWVLELALALLILGFEALRALRR